MSTPWITSRGWIIVLLYVTFVLLCGPGAVVRADDDDDDNNNKKYNKDQRFQYAAKYVCGPGTDVQTFDETYRTAINIHNPNAYPVVFTKKVAATFPSADPNCPACQVPGVVTSPQTDQLLSDQALEMDCEEIGDALNRNCLLSEFCKGFVVITTKTKGLRLDVTAVYTTNDAIDVNRVCGRGINNGKAGPCNED